ncbi:MAG: Maf family protein [Pseudomonadota bacterium]
MILASASKARADLLRAAGVDVDIHPARIDEAAVKQAMLAEDASPRDIADMLAELKAKQVSMRHPHILILGADQVLVCEDQLFDKAETMVEARSHLQQLSGKTHHLYSAAVIARDGEPVWRHVGHARLSMRPFTEAFLDNYLDRVGDLALSSVGCYHLEGLGAQLFARVEGDYFTVLGLPLLEVLGFLRAQEVLVE